MRWGMEERTRPRLLSIRRIPAAGVSRVSAGASPPPVCQAYIESSSPPGWVLVGSPVSTRKLRQPAPGHGASERQSQESGPGEPAALCKCLTLLRAASPKLAKRAVPSWDEASRRSHGPLALFQNVLLLASGGSSFTDPVTGQKPFSTPPQAARVSSRASVGGLLSWELGVYPPCLANPRQSPL